MKWYWAILQTIAILTVLTFVKLVAHIPEDIIFIFIALAAIWVAADSSSFGWGMCVILFWPLFYPWYLIKRDKIRLQSYQDETFKRERQRK